MKLRLDGITDLPVGHPADRVPEGLRRHRRADADGREPAGVGAGARREGARGPAGRSPSCAPRTARRTGRATHRRLVPAGARRARWSNARAGSWRPTFEQAGFGGTCGWTWARGSSSSTARLPADDGRILAAVTPVHRGAPAADRSSTPTCGSRPWCAIRRTRAARLAAVAGDKYSYRELDEFTDLIQKTVQTIPAASKVERSGVLAQRVYLDYSQQRLAAYGLHADGAAAAVRARATRSSRAACSRSGRRTSPSIRRASSPPSTRSAR